MLDRLTEEQVAYVLQFQHPEKTLARLPNVKDEFVAPMFGLSAGDYRRIRKSFDDRARGAAEALLGDQSICDAVDRLPFREGDTLVGLGDSITDDLQSWLEILRYLLALRRSSDRLKVINAGISGDTTSQMISRFLAVVIERPQWVFVLAGTNDARLHGLSPAKNLVSIDETELNFAMLRNYAATQTAARMVFMTPPSVIEDQIGNHWFLGPMQMMWRNDDLAAIAEISRSGDDPFIDLNAHFGQSPNPSWLLDDGLHPSLEGQMEIVKTLITRMAEG